MAKPLLVAAVAVPLFIAITVGCGGPGTATVSSAGSCAGPASASAAQYRASATVAFVGVMLPGPEVQLGNRNVLTSPARVRVTHWLKGNGPSVVTVNTGAVRNGAGIAENEDGVLPAPGQRWVIYAMSKQMPYQTSICSGSAVTSGR